MERRVSGQACYNALITLPAGGAFTANVEDWVAVESSSYKLVGAVPNWERPT